MGKYLLILSQFVTDIEKLSFSRYLCFSILLLSIKNLIGDVMVRMIALSAVDCEFELRSDQTKDCRIGICCFSAKHAALRRESKD